MENKTKTIQVRITPTMYSELKSKIPQFGSVSNYIMMALSEYSNSTARVRMEQEKLIASLYRSIDANLAHTGANINQAMRRINECSKAGMPYTLILERQLYPELRTYYDMCASLREQLRNITSEYAK